MADREKMMRWVYQAVETAGGEASLLQVARHIWENHEIDLRASGDDFYTWQYDMRWAAQKLRDEKKFVSTAAQTGRKWAIAK
jgi:hypothetical protein